MHLYTLQISSTSTPASKQAPPVTLVHCHTTNSTYHANHLIHQVIDIINHVKLSTTHAHPSNRTTPSSTHPKKAAVIFPLRRALLSHSGTGTGLLRFGRLVLGLSNLGVDFVLSSLLIEPLGYRVLWQAGHARATRAASDEGRELSVTPTNGVAERWGSCGVLEPVVSTGLA